MSGLGIKSCFSEFYRPKVNSGKGAGESTWTWLKTLVWFSCREYIVNSTNLSYNLDDLRSENYNFIFDTCIIKTWSSHGGWQKELCRTCGLSQMLSWACFCSSIVRQSSVALEAQVYTEKTNEPFSWWSGYLNVLYLQ